MQDAVSKKCSANNLSRREFLRMGTAASIGLATGSLWMPKTLRARTNETSRVVIVTDVQAANGSSIRPDVVRVMLDEGIKALMDAATPSQAWLTIFPDLALDMGIGIKVNTINATYLPSHPDVAYPIAESLAATPVGVSNFPENQIVIWDRCNAELEESYYTINTSTSGVRCFGTDHDGIGFHPDALTILGESEQVSRCYTDYSDRLINLSVLKNASTGGVTFSLKNHYGTISNPSALHYDACNPGIPAVNSELISQLGARQNLCVCDAIFGCTSGGPMGPVNLVYNGIVLSQDPVALDTICRQILEDHGCTTGNLAVYIETASNPPYNLGNSNLADIEVIHIENPCGFNGEDEETLPIKITLGKNYPEPFNGRTTIPLTLDRVTNVRLEIYNIEGRRIAVLYRGVLPPGKQTFTWDGICDNGRDAPSGKYFARLITNGRVHSRGMTLLR